MPSHENDPSQFLSEQSFYHFIEEVTHSSRYHYSPDTEAFLEAVRITSKKRKTPIPQNAGLWRAQLGHQWRDTFIDNTSSDYVTEPYPYEACRMKPLQYKAADGRANPRGIPYLYLARTKETAISEVRPWVGSYVSCGQFCVKRPLTVVNCTDHDKRNNLYIDFKTLNSYEPEPLERERVIWSDIGTAFSRPIDRADDTAFYVPTQILAELFKKMGMDGVIYQSNFGENGYNICLFDTDDADLVDCSLFEIKSVSVNFERVKGSYSI